VIAEVDPGPVPSNHNSVVIDSVSAISPGSNSAKSPILESNSKADNFGEQVAEYSAPEDATLPLKGSNDYVVSMLRI